MVAGNFEARGVQREEGGFLLQQKLIARDAPAAILEHQTVAAAFKGHATDVQTLCALDIKNVRAAKRHELRMPGNTFNLQ